MRTEIRPEELTDNAFQLIGSEWMLITAGPPDDHNTMTASWGGLGVIWNQPVCWCVVRPQRHTFPFLEREEAFTLSFFEERYRSALDFCGSRSGRSVPDKARAAGLTPEPGALPRTTAFAEARLVIACRKVYWQDLEPARFLDQDIAMHYPAGDFHRMYFGEVKHVGVAR